MESNLGDKIPACKDPGKGSSRQAGQHMQRPWGSSICLLRGKESRREEERRAGWQRLENWLSSVGITPPVDHWVKERFPSATPGIPQEPPTPSSHFPRHLPPWVCAIFATRLQLPHTVFSSLLGWGASLFPPQSHWLPQRRATVPRAPPAHPLQMPSAPRGPWTPPAQRGLEGGVGIHCHVRIQHDRARREPAPQSGCCLPPDHTETELPSSGSQPRFLPRGNLDTGRHPVEPTSRGRGRILPSEALRTGTVARAATGFSNSLLSAVISSSCPRQETHLGSSPSAQSFHLGLDRQKVPVAKGRAHPGQTVMKQLRQALSQKATLQSICIKRRPQGQEIPMGARRAERPLYVENASSIWIPKASLSNRQAHPLDEKTKIILLLFNFDVENVDKGAKNTQ